MKKLSSGLLTLLFVLPAGQTVLAQTSGATCTDWQWESETRLPGSINEASGMAKSRDHNRLFHVNDSGNSASVFITGLSGESLGQFELKAKENNDYEAIAVGPCQDSSKSCIFVGDIGDNAYHRDSIQIHVIGEKDQFEKDEDVLNSLNLVYPDGAHNAEAMGITPTGDLVILSKESKFFFWQSPGKAKVYRFSRQQLFTSASGKLDLSGEIDIPGFLPAASDDGLLVTDLAFHPNGKQLAILTYEFILLLNWHEGADYSNAAGLKKDKDYWVIPIKKLKQAESITFISPSELLVSSEGKSPKLHKYSCVNQLETR